MLSGYMTPLSLQWPRGQQMHWVKQHLVAIKQLSVVHPTQSVTCTLQQHHQTSEKGEKEILFLVLSETHKHQSCFKCQFLKKLDDFIIWWLTVPIKTWTKKSTLFLTKGAHKMRYVRNGEMKTGGWVTETRSPKPWRWCSLAENYCIQGWTFSH